MYTCSIQLESPRLIFRPLTDLDIPNIQKGLSCDCITEFMGVNKDELLEITQNLTIINIPYTEASKELWWAICDKQSGDFMGVGGYNSMNIKHFKGELAMWLFKEFWGRGILPETVNTFCEFGFSKLKFQRIEGYVNAKNTNSFNAFQKLNFTFEGTLRDYEFINGEFVSYQAYSMLNPNREL